jgi:hypothetical protein
MYHQKLTYAARSKYEAPFPVHYMTCSCAAWNTVKMIDCWKRSLICLLPQVMIYSTDLKYIFISNNHMVVLNA